MRIPKKTFHQELLVHRLSFRWYASIFNRNRFEPIHHTMLDASEAGAETEDKIEPFLNNLIDNFQVAFSPFKDWPSMRW